MKTDQERRDHHAAYMRGWRARHVEAVRAGDRAYSRTPAGKAARANGRRTWRKNHPEQDRANAAVERAVRRGNLTKGPCVVCGDPRTEGHHYLGYAAEHRLHVVWLCKPHHQAAHGRGPLADRAEVPA